jgi:hypothetical protein
MTKKEEWGIWISGATEGWLNDGGFWDDNQDWIDLPAVYPTRKSAMEDVKWLNKDSKATYEPKKFS